MLTSWQKLTYQKKTSWYYFQGGESGRALTGWQKLGSSWYYLNPVTAQMATDWQNLSYNGKKAWYFFERGDSGRMATGKRTIDGTRYTFASGGALLSPATPPLG
jgi:glucan-binding YG repeat protein